MSSVHTDPTAEQSFPICRGFESHGLSATAVPRFSWTPTPASTRSRHSALVGFQVSASSASSQPMTMATPHQQPHFRLHRSHALPLHLRSFQPMKTRNDAAVFQCASIRTLCSVVTVSRFLFQVSTESERTPMRYVDSPFGAHRAPVTEPAPAFAPAGSAPVTRSACITRRSNPLSALEKKKRTSKVSRQSNGL